MSALDGAAAQHQWHLERLAKLCADDGWLTLTDLIWLEDGCHMLGSGADCTLHLAGTPPQWGELRVIDGAVDWLPAAPGATPQRLQSDRNGAPDIVAHGDISFFVIERDGALALRVRDRQASARRQFAGIELFPYAAAWQIEAHWDGSHARFQVDGQPLALLAQASCSDPLQFVFGDTSSGRDTYGGGRFLFATPAADGRLRLDFNRAINPPCAFTPYTVCPLPPAENRLPLVVAAGEKRYRTGN